MWNEEIEQVYTDKEILSYIKSKVRHDDVEEILQSAILELLQVKHKENIKNFKNYFFGIVKNVICKYYKNKHDDLELKEYGLEVSGGINSMEENLKNYPLLYLKYCGYGWRESGYCERTYYKKLKREKEKLYEEICL